MFSKGAILAVGLFSALILCGAAAAGFYYDQVTGQRVDAHQVSYAAPVQANLAKATFSAVKDEVKAEAKTLAQSAVQNVATVPSTEHRLPEPVHHQIVDPEKSEKKTLEIREKKTESNTPDYLLKYVPKNYDTTGYYVQPQSRACPCQPSNNGNGGGFRRFGRR